LVEREVVFSLSIRQPVGCAGEATLASSGVVENAVQKKLAGHAQAASSK
jgi:hypothetical protein